MVVEIFKSACLNRAMITSSLVGDFKSQLLNMFKLWCERGIISSVTNLLVN